MVTLTKVFASDVLMISPIIMITYNIIASQKKKKKKKAQNFLFCTRSMFSYDLSVFGSTLYQFFFFFFWIGISALFSLLYYMHNEEI